MEYFRSEIGDQLALIRSIESTARQVVQEITSEFPANLLVNE